MAFRFRRTLKVAPGVRLNLSKGGLSGSLGPQGFSTSVGRQGLHGNIGLPGTGLSYRSRLGDSNQARTASQLSPALEPDSVRIVLQDSGAVEFQDADGARLPQRLERLVKQQYGDALSTWLEEQCDLINKALEERVTFHLNTPFPEENQQFPRASFKVAPPQEPEPREPGMLDTLFRRRERIERENREGLEAYEKETKEWEEERANFERSEDRRRLVFEELRYSDQDVMHDYLSDVLQALHWPGETTVSFELADGGATAFADIDLPEIEDFPRKTARIAARGLKLIFKDVSESQHRKNYAQHVHGIGFRVVGIAFSSLPKLETVVLSAYSQRPDKTTGHVRDDYLYSIRIPRRRWSQIDFSGLERLDLAEALGAFEIRREMSKAGVFQPVEPFGPDDKSAVPE